MSQDRANLPQDAENSSGAFGRRLSQRRAWELAEQVGRLAQAGLPLAEGLRAAAAEAGWSQWASTLRWLANKMETGEAPEQLFSSRRSKLPESVGKLITTALESGHLPQVLLELTAFQRLRRDMWRRVWLAVAYPAALGVSVVGLSLLILQFITPQFNQIYRQFNVALPTSTRFLLGLSHASGDALLPALIMLAIFVGVLRLCLGRARWRWVLWSVPVAGPLFEWSATAEWTRLLRILLRENMPLPEALRLSASGVGDAYVAACARQLANDVQQGQSLHRSLIEAPRLTASVIPVIGWAEQTNNLPEALYTASEMLEGRIRLRTLWLTSVVPPLAFIVVGTLALGTAASLLVPLVSLLSNL